MKLPLLEVKSMVPPDQLLQLEPELHVNGCSNCMKEYNTHIARWQS